MEFSRKSKKLRNFKKQRGFTLIELVVVLALFMIIIGAAVNVLLSMVQQQKRILAEQEILNQTSYAFEYMSRGLRMATADVTGTCTGAVGAVYLLTHCVNGGAQSYPCHGVKFVNRSDSNACQEFYLDETDGIFKETRNGSTPQFLLSSKFTVKKVNFALNGNINSNIAFQSNYGVNNTQPRIAILLDVQTQLGGNQQEKTIQTTVSQRNLNSVDK